MTDYATTQRRTPSKRSHKHFHSVLEVTNQYTARLYRCKQAPEFLMAEVHTIEHRSSEKLRGRDRRSLNLSTKLTAVEARVIEDAATRAGKTPSEWAREALLRAAQGGSSNPLGMDIFIESVGSQMLMMAAFDPLLKAS